LADIFGELHAAASVPTVSMSADRV